MKVTINRNYCGSWPPACDECFGTFLLHGSVPDRACITDVEDDGSQTLNAVVKSGEYVGKLVIRPEDRETAIREGWRQFSDLPDEAFDIKPPRGEELRAANKA